MSTEKQRDLLRDKLSTIIIVTPKIEAWINTYQGDLTFLYQAYSEIKNDKPTVDISHDVTYSLENSLCTVKSEEFSFLLEKQTLLKVIQLTVDILTPILPLGSVVDLKKEYLEKSFSNNIEKFRMIIQARYMFFDELKIYIPYGGVVYPFGSFGGEKQLHFTPALIDKVVHYGFSDEQEEAFETLMKQELIIEKNMCSIAFATAAQRDKLQNVMAL